MIYKELDLPKKGERVAVGLSGGVDSTMTALLLKEKGCDVTCVTMSLWAEGTIDFPDGFKIPDSCYSPKEIEDIEENQKFCEKEGIPFVVADVKKEYQNEVLEYFKCEYRSGRTPNPCVMCNRFIKFGALLSYIDSIGIDFDYFCTGHYAKTVRGSDTLVSLFGENASKDLKGQSRPVQIQVASDPSKDQSYFLNRISSSVLEKVRFPLANLEKKDVVLMARKRGLRAAEKKESQDFIPEPALECLFSDKPSVPGDFVSLEGHVLGKHRGIEHYTVGQRRGLGISSSSPLYVAEIDSEKNIVVLGRDADLLCSGLIACDIVWPSDYDPQCAFEAMVKIRLASKPIKARVSPITKKDLSTSSYEVIFEESQRAVAPGQSVVFYMDGVIVGGGIIERALKL